MFPCLRVQKWDVGDLLEKILERLQALLCPVSGGTNSVFSHAEKHTKMLPRVSGLWGPLLCGWVCYRHLRVHCIC